MPFLYQTVGQLITSGKETVAVSKMNSDCPPCGASYFYILFQDDHRNCQGASIGALEFECIDSIAQVGAQSGYAS